MPNAYQPHVMIVPEDAACRDVANGFVLRVDRDRAVQVLPPMDGWANVRDALVRDAFRLARFPERRLVVIVDFDNDLGRAEAVMGGCPDAIKDRVYIVGARDEVEDLRSSLVAQGRLDPNTLEGIGRLLAADCRHEAVVTWSHDMLGHNEAQYERMRTDLRALLFDV
jgi:hypothetical protein